MFKNIIFLAMFFLTSCLRSSSIEINIAENSKKPYISSVQLINDQLIIIGEYFSTLKTAELDGKPLLVLSKSDNQLVLKGSSLISLALDSALNIVVTNAFGASNVSVTFNLVDGSVSGSKLSDMGAGAGQFLQYNGSFWSGADLSGLTYMGKWNALTNSPSLADGVGNNGEYYIVSVSGTQNLGSGNVTLAIGDWLIHNGTTYEKIEYSTVTQSKWSENGNDLFYSSGKIGIGTSNPDGSIHVLSNGVGSGTKLERNDDNDNAIGVLRIARSRSSATPPGSEFGASINFALEGFTDNLLINTAKIKSIWENAQTNDLSDRNSAITFENISNNSVSEVMRISSSGNVGIGTSTPSYKLHVNGSIAGTSAYSNLSDIRYKKNFLPISDDRGSALSKISKINGKYYFWRKDEFPGFEFDEGRDIGVIAQEVRKVFPEAIKEDNNGFLTVAYSKLIAPIIEAIKELSSKTEKYSTDILVLKRENLKLKNEINDLKIFLCKKDTHADFCSDKK